MRTAAIATGVGIGASTALFVLVSLIGGQLLAWLMLSGAPTATLANWVLPSRFFYWYAPEGGADAAIPLFVVSAWLQWSILFGVLAAFLMKRRKQ